MIEKPIQSKQKNSHNTKPEALFYLPYALYETISAVVLRFFSRSG